ncbi:MAG: guanylate kinase [Roseburia sp.]|nr:guanylate kinase [Roseburia sp.]
MTRKNKGILTVVSGFSGAGKGTIMKELLAKYGQNYALSISATTRAPRPGETDGVEYFFKSRGEFEQMIADGELIEYAQYVGNYYGTPKAYVKKQLEAGRDVILEIEIQGALKVRKQFPDALLLFVTPPSADELKKRLIGRGTESMEVIENRLARALEEAEGLEEYDYLVVNDVLEECVEEVHGIIQNERYRVSRNADNIREMREELKGFTHRQD